MTSPPESGERKRIIELVEKLEQHNTEPRPLFSKVLLMSFQGKFKYTRALTFEKLLWQAACQRSHQRRVAPALDDFREYPRAQQVIHSVVESERASERARERERERARERK